MQTFTARNRARITALLLASTANYFVTAVVTGAALGVFVVVWVLAHANEIPSTGDGWKILGLVTLTVAAFAAVIALIAAAIGLPHARRSLEEGMLLSPSVTLDETRAHPQLANIVEGLAIAAGIPPPRIAIVDDPAPNSFGVGTRPRGSVVAVTTGLLAELTRPQLEAVIAYEITRVASLDVALTTWVIALTAEVSETTNANPIVDLVGSWNRRFANRMRDWALRDSVVERDRAAIAMSRNPAALVAALEVLAADGRVVAWMQPETAALWIEVPASVAHAADDHASRQLDGLMLRDRIGALRELASLPPP